MKMNNIVYMVACLITLIFPRSNSIWVFGNKKGFTDNTRYFFEHSSGIGKNKCIWLAASDPELSEVKSLGYEAVKKDSILGIFYSLRSGVQFMCNGFGDLNRGLALGAKVVNFWHGTPIKKVYLDAEHDSKRFGKHLRFASRLALATLNKFIFVYYASNSLELNLITGAARISRKKTACLGSPRFDYIRKTLLNPPTYQKIPKNSKVILFAPTWRENANWPDSYTLTDAEISTLGEILSLHECSLILKPHPLTSLNEIIKWRILEVKNVFIASEIGMKDINEAYAISDLLITDISSALFDYLITGESIIFFMPDLDEYMTGDRGIYDYYREVINSSCTKGWPELINKIKIFLTGSKVTTSDLLFKITEEAKTKKRTCESIYNDLQTRIQ